MADAIGRAFPEGTRVSRPQGGFVLWVEMPKKVDSILLYKKAKGQGITIAPGSIFSIEGKYRNCVRLNAACWNPSVEVAIDTLGRLAAEQLNETEGR
jgi:DNA-binding transcriptional MocR family regulator